MNDQNHSLQSFLRFRVRNSDQSIKSLVDLKGFIDESIQRKEKKISSKRIKVRISRGIWTSNERLVQLIVNKNINQLMILNINSMKYLRPFESLYLMENHSLELLFNEIPLSIEESFKLFLTNQNQFNYYRIFSFLLRSGYFVRNHVSTQTSDSNKSRKRKLSEDEINRMKTFETNTNFYELSTKIANYKSIKNIGPIIEPTIITTNNENIYQKTLIYEIEESEKTIELNPSLILFNGSIKPLCDLGILYSNEQLFDLMKSFGPKYMTGLKSTQTEFDLTLDVFTHSTKKINRNPDFNVIVTKSDERVPQINDIINLEENNSKPTYFAVLDSNDFAFYSISCHQINDEFPVLWQKYAKSF